MKKIPIHAKSNFEGMKKAGKMAANTLDMIEEFIKPGVTTEALDKICYDFITSNGGICAPLGYKGFPKSMCTSVNHVVCHGIPSDYELRDGDIVGIDVTPILDGWHGDSCRTFFVGNSFTENDPKTIKAKRLTKVTYNAMMNAINLVKPGIKLAEIGKSIQSYVAKYNFSVVRDFCGHGVGKTFHTEPMVPHYYADDVVDYADSITLEEGMFFTIEPMINAGRFDVNVSKIDSWTVTTKDRQLSAQFEHTIGVTANGCEIFTKSDNFENTRLFQILDSIKL
ncbi:Methionine aminopeptidase [Candidatus Deianiraea vastatrix]|uniref:Methionine aminopeptidase n=1 Tax=Candidatus Deianiraea vastatrix TaxID=2163644 RepID=A0A5B8XF22_9RICK|nr:type I methionyl aminopeptidase [Candidatus Deianiraea vastatrix]QED23505.1 Methionine aminopeptidase [Candidatus Deianiraea vastatrix]